MYYAEEISMTISIADRNMGNCQDASYKSARHGTNTLAIQGPQRIQYYCLIVMPKARTTSQIGQSVPTAGIRGQFMALEWIYHLHASPG
jgi:hypothetical protein